MNADRVRRHVEALWDDSIVPELVEYIRIPNKSPHFDPDWAEHGYMEAAVDAHGALVRGERPARDAISRWSGSPGGPPSSSSRCRARGTTASSSTATSTSSPR